MKSSVEALRVLRGRRRWHAAPERGLHSVSQALRDYIEMLRPTAQALDEPMCALDLSGRIRFANLSLQRLLGCSEVDLISVNVHDVIPCAADHADIQTSQARDEQEACVLRRADGSNLFVRCVFQRISREGQTLGTMLIVPSTVTSDAQVRAQLEDERAVERRLRILDAVGDVSLAELPLDDLLNALLDRLRREMRLQNAAIFLIDPASETLVARAASGQGEEFAEHIRVPLADTRVGQAMLDHRTIFVPDADKVGSQWVYFTPEVRDSLNVRSLMMAPLVVEERLIGAIYLGASEAHYFTQQDAHLAELIGSRAALAIERARASDEAAIAQDRLRFLTYASAALNETLDYHDTTKRLSAIVTPSLADACAIYLLEEDGLLRKVATQTPPPGSYTTDPVSATLQRLVERMDATVEINPDDTSAVAQSVRSRRTVIDRHPVDLAPAPGDQTPQQGTVDCLCVSTPLVVRQHAVGALHLAMRPDKELSDGELALLQGLAERAAIAIDNARLYDETQQALATGSATATQLDTIFNATDVGIFVTDANGGYLRINPYGARLLGLNYASPEQVPLNVDGPFELRTTEGEVIPPERVPLRVARVEGRAIEQRFVIHRLDTGRDIQALTRCTPWRDERNQIAGAISVVTDITAIYELERQKDEFLGIASHELKTPLTSLKILAQLLRRKMEASGEQRELEQALRMQVAITRMERLIHDLLDVTLIQEGNLPLHLELVDLCDICTEAIQEQRLLTQRPIRFSAPANGAGLPTYADRDRIYQVISNLLSNAIKYSPATEQVSVRVRATEDECIVAVHDHGPGVPPEALDHIFDRFFRVPGMQVQSGSGVGLGLGLHISKDIISRHGGRIWVESKLGHGSTFAFALPRAHAQFAESTESQITDSGR